MRSAAAKDRFRKHRPASSRNLTSMRRAYDLLRSQLPTLGPGAVLVEQELMEGLSASRNTVRLVLRLLAEQGVVTRGPKVGTTVICPTILPLHMILPCAAGWRDGGIQSRIRESRVIPAPAILRGRLALDPGRAVAMVESLLVEDSVPVALAVSYFALRADAGGPCASIDAIAVARDRELFVDKCATVVTAVSCDPQTALLLEVQPGSPILWRDDLLCDLEGRPWAISQVRYRGDRVVLSVTTARSTNDHPVATDATTSLRAGSA